jgi:NAD(P)-dependent dehydrogenase (short-subunit alcohol dehydrogenase family)
MSKAYRDKSVVITGASTGIGRACAVRLADRKTTPEVRVARGGIIPFP